MTKIYKTILTLTMAVVLLSSCKDDDDTVVVDMTNLTVGTWTFSNSEADNSSTTIFINLFYEGVAYEFNADNTYTETYLGENEISGDWSFTDNMLTFGPEEDDMLTFTVTELSPSTLKLFARDEDLDTDVTLIFTK